MTLRRYSLSQLVAWGGTASILILFVPLGVYLAQLATSSAEQFLAERGESLARTLAGQIIDEMLVEDRLAVYEALTKAVADEEVRYIYVENARGEPVAHTFADGFPHALTGASSIDDGAVRRFRTKNGPILEVRAPIMSGKLGSLRVGMFRRSVMEARNRALLPLGISLVLALSVVLLGAYLVGIRVSRPLRRLAAQVSRFPEEQMAGDLPRVTGTREVERLAQGFAEMAGRLAALERERTATQASMIHAERLAALGELSAGLAHEVHNPLDGMLECVRYLESDPDRSQRTIKYLPMLQDGLTRIADAMRQMLTFARPGHKMNVEPCSAGELADSMELMLRKHMETHRVSLTWQRPGPCQCLCDRSALSQAMLNLVLNAAEAAEKDADPRVRVETMCDPEWIYLTVEDSGTGVPAELRERIFDPFFTTKPHGKGTGLGLAISRQLIRACGGELELSDEPAALGGARFLLRLPKADCQECGDA